MSNRPAQAARKDTDAGGTVKTGRHKPPGKTAQCLPVMTIPILGYQNHMAMDRTYGFIRHSTVTDSACHDGAMLRHLVTGGNSAPEVWTGTAYRSQAHEAWLADQGLVSRIHQQKLPGRTMHRRIARSNARKPRPSARPSNTSSRTRSGAGGCSSASSACRHQDRAGQSRLQLPASGLPPTPGCHGMIPSARPPNRSRNTQ